MKRLAGAVWLLLYLLTCFAMYAYAEERAVSEWVPQTMSDGAATYWTKERMQKAKPYPTPSIETKPEQFQQQAVEQPGEMPGAIKGSPPEKLLPSLPELQDQAKPGLIPGDAANQEELSDSLRIMSDGYDYPPPHTTFYVFNKLYGSSNSTFPYCTIGKVFFTESNNVDYVCSGASIGGRAVLTAGHCVSDGSGNWHKNWVFVPAYQNGKSPYGKWYAFWKTTSDSWHKNGDFSRDVGFAAVKDQGKNLSSKIGHLGFAWNYSRVQHWNMFGYPASYPYSGDWMVTTQASYAGIDGSKKPSTSGIGTDQTGGCSGGPWVLGFGDTNYANGVNSYNFKTLPREMYSPYFDTWIKKNLYDPAIAK